jgi:translation initiation factor 1 (eIF-1/SUI1)
MTSPLLTSSGTEHTATTPTTTTADAHDDTVHGAMEAADAAPVAAEGPPTLTSLAFRARSTCHSLDEEDEEGSDWSHESASDADSDASDPEDPPANAAATTEAGVLPIFNDQFNARNLFQDAGHAEVEVWYKQRNGRKTFSIVGGLPPGTVTQGLMKQWRAWGCCVSVDAKQKVWLTGDHRGKVAHSLVSNGICRLDEIHIHGPAMVDVVEGGEDVAVAQQLAGTIKVSRDKAKTRPTTTAPPRTAPPMQATAPPMQAIVHKNICRVVNAAPMSEPRWSTSETPVTTKAATTTTTTTATAVAGVHDDEDEDEDVPAEPELTPAQVTAWSGLEATRPGTERQEDEEAIRFGMRLKVFTKTLSQDGKRAVKRGWNQWLLEHGSDTVETDAAGNSIGMGSITGPTTTTLPLLPPPREGRPLQASEDEWFVAPVPATGTMLTNIEDQYTTSISSPKSKKKLKKLQKQAKVTVVAARDAAVLKSFAGTASSASRLPTGPQRQSAVRHVDIDPALLPRYPPYTAFVGNLPYGVDGHVLTTAITQFFQGHGVECTGFRSPRDGFGYAEFARVDALKIALGASGIRMMVANQACQPRISLATPPNSRSSGSNSSRMQDRTHDRNRPAPYVPRSGTEGSRYGSAYSSAAPTSYSAASTTSTPTSTRWRSGAIDREPASVSTTSATATATDTSTRAVPATATAGGAPVGTPWGVMGACKGKVARCVICTKPSIPGNVDKLCQECCRGRGNTTMVPSIQPQPQSWSRSRDDRRGTFQPSG